MAAASSEQIAALEAQLRRARRQIGQAPDDWQVLICDALDLCSEAGDEEAMQLLELAGANRFAEWFGNDAAMLDPRPRARGGEELARFCASRRPLPTWVLRWLA